MEDMEIHPLESNSVTPLIKQGVIGYILYGLIFFYVYTGYDSAAVIPMGLPIGISNMMAAGSSNTMFKKEFTENNLVNKTIKPKETVYGLVAFKDMNTKKLK